jgi:hypothetical protein
MTLLNRELYLLYKQTQTLNNLHDFNISTNVYKYYAPYMSNIIRQHKKDKIVDTRYEVISWEWRSGSTRL